MKSLAEGLQFLQYDGVFWEYGSLICLSFFLLSFLFLVLFFKYSAPWAAFALPRKGISRVLLFMLGIPIALSLLTINIVFLSRMPITLVPEKPNLTEVAIKQGIFFLLLDEAVESQLPEEKQNLARCLRLFSLLEAGQGACFNDQACIEKLFTASKEDLIGKIKAFQKTALSAGQGKQQDDPLFLRTHEACDALDLDKI